MEVVQPITDQRTLKGIAEYLKSRNERDYVLFCTGIYTGLRIADILELRVFDVQGQSHIQLREGKTRKSKLIKISPVLLDIYKTYTEGKSSEEYLFKSRVGENKPITRERAYAVLKDAAQQFGLQRIGCHSLRKTFGYWMYASSKNNIALLMDIFNHSQESITLRYIGLSQEIKDNAIDDLVIF